MPGICGILTPGRAEDPSLIKAMADSMRHETHYSVASLQNEAGLFGWAVHGESFSDCLPIWNESHDVCLLFAGEAFVDASDLTDLQARGHSFRRGNATFLIHLYEEVGAKFFEALNGIFCGALIDFKQKRAMLFNDRYGLGRVYYHQGKDGFYFASEAKAILKVRPELKTISAQGFGEYFACGCVLQDRTLFPEIFLLPPGSVWTFDFNGAVQKESYFDRAAWENQEPISTEQYYQQLRETFSRILPRYFFDLDRMAMSLTGGLDSRLIMACAQISPGKLQCYSHSGIFHECADASVARRVATVCGQPHRVVKVDDGFLKQFHVLAPQTVRFSDGMMDVVGAAGLYANRTAKKEITGVRLTGNYGGEVLRSMVSLKDSKLKLRFCSSGLLDKVKEGKATLQAQVSGGRPLSVIAFKQVPWHHYARFAMENSQLVVRSPYLDNDLMKVAFRAPESLEVNQHLAARLIKDGNPKLATFPTDRGPLGRSGLLGKVAERWQEFTFKAEYAYDYGMPNSLVRIDNVFRRFHFERLFLGRHKYCHFRYFYRTSLAPYLKEILLDRRTLKRSFFEPKAVEEIVTGHTSGKANYTLEIHALLTAELIQRELIETN